MPLCNRSRNGSLPSTFCTRSSAWIEHQLAELRVVGSNPAGCTIRLASHCVRSSLMVNPALRGVFSVKKELYNSERSQTTQAKYLNRGHSSVGRALPWHGRGQGFESPWLHHVKSLRDHVAQPNTMQLEAQSDFTCHGTT